MILAQRTLAPRARLTPPFTIVKKFSRSEKKFHDREKLILAANLSDLPTAVWQKIQRGLAKNSVGD